MSSSILSPTVVRRLGALLLAVLLHSAAQAQTGTVNGVVTDGTTGETLIGATVAIEGTTRGTATGVTGAYSLALSPGTYTLRANYTGFIPQEQTVTVTSGGTATQNFALEEDLTGLEEVVVTGALSSRSLAQSEVAVSRIDAAALTEIVPYTDVSSLLNGKAAGVSVQPSSGNVGGGVRFNIRAQGGLNGSGQPLIFIDGIRINNSQLGGYGVGGQQVGALADLNPNDIDDVEVLKGPAASALYGTDASNGVVLITTKRGKLGGAGQGAVPFSLSYQGVAGSNSQQFDYDEATAGETVQSANNIFQTGAIQQHTISASGGSEAVRYFTQFDYRDEDGIVSGNFQNRRSVRGNFEAFPFRNVTIGVNTNYTFNKVGSPNNDNNILGYLGNVLLFPTPYNFTDSLAVTQIQTVFNTNRFLGGFNALYTPVAGLSLAGNVGLDIANGRQDRTFPSNFQYSGRVNGERSAFIRDNGQVSFQLDAKYAYTPIADLDLSTSVGAQGFDARNRTLFVQQQNFATSLITDIGAGQDFQSAGEGFVNVRQFGVLAEQSLDYKNTYFLSGGLRSDFASSVSVDQQNILYPTIRGAIRLDKFAPVPSAFSILKLRAAYGESGQLPDPTDPIFLLYQAVVGGDGAGASPVSIGNPLVQPERVSELELGVDLELFSRASLQATYYFQDASQSIFGVRQAPSTGLVASLVPTNVGSIQGQGLELSLDVTAYRSRDANLSLGFIYSHQTNEVQSIGTNAAGDPLPPLFDGFSVNTIRPGLPRAAFFVTPVNGASFNSTTGAYSGVDAGITDDNLADYQARIDSGECINEPGTAADRCYFGQPYAKDNGSFTFNLNLFRDFTLYALADFQTGLSVYNNTLRFQSQFGNNAARNDLRKQLFGFKDDAGNDVPASLTPGTQEYTDAADAYARTSNAFSANFIEKADFLKFRELTVRYNLGRLISQQAGLGIVRTASLALSARNLFTTSKYSGVDPEVNFNGARSLSRGQDFLTLQNPRQFFVTLQLGI